MKKLSKSLILLAILSISQQAIGALNPIDQYLNEDARLRRYAKLHNIKLPEYSGYPKLTKYFLSDDIDMLKKYDKDWKIKYQIDIPEQNVVIRLWHNQYLGEAKSKKQNKNPSFKYHEGCKYELILYHNDIPIKLCDSSLAQFVSSSFLLVFNASAGYSPVTKKLYYFETIGDRLGVFIWDINSKAIKNYFAERFVKLTPKHEFQQNGINESICLTRENGFILPSRWSVTSSKEFCNKALYYNILTNQIYPLGSSRIVYRVLFNYLPQEFATIIGSKTTILGYTVKINGEKLTKARHFNLSYFKDKNLSYRHLLNRLYFTLISNALEEKIQNQKLPKQAQLEKELVNMVDNFCDRYNITFKDFFQGCLKPRLVKPVKNGCFITSEVSQQTTDKLKYGSINPFSKEAFERSSFKKHLKKFKEITLTHNNFKRNYLINKWVKNNHREYTKLTASDEEIKKFYDDYKWFFERKLLSDEFYTLEEKRDFIASEIKRLKYYRLEKLLTNPPKISIRKW